MQRDRQEATNGTSSASSAPASVRVGGQELRSSHGRRAHVIDTLSAAISTLRVAVSARKAGTAELRAEQKRRVRASESTELRLDLDVWAPAVARAAVADRLKSGVPAAVVGAAQLVVSELVTNSVRHSGASAEERLILRLELSAGMVRLEVEDPGRDGTVAPRPPDPDGGGGRGLNLVQAISERWGVERIAAGGTRVWAQLAL